MKYSIQGNYCDKLIDFRGRELWSSGWRSNLIVESCDLLLASLMKREPETEGILYWAVGEGEASWELGAPVAASTTSQLSSETARKLLVPKQIVYLDETGQLTDTPTSRLEVASKFTTEDFETNAPIPLREFGLFGGDATEVPDSGFIIDYVIHPRIELTPGVTLSRKLRLTFGAGALEQEELGEFGAALPVISIDGVGDEYSSDLGGQGIESLGDLAEIDPLLSIGNIPQVKLREFRAKARMVMRLRISLTPFMTLADRSISSLLRKNPEDLAGVIGAPAVTPEVVTGLQEELAVLQIALDDEQLQSITIDELINA